MKTIKTAVSLPAETYHKAEKLRKKLGKSRSEMVAQALAKLLRDAEILEIEARDAEAYRLHPETPEELSRARSASKQAWKHLRDDDVDWEKYFAPR